MSNFVGSNSELDAKTVLKKHNMVATVVGAGEIVETVNSLSPSVFRLENAHKCLNLGVKSWFVIALAGQWAFATYIMFIYAIPVALGIDIANITPTQGYGKTNGLDYVLFFSHIVPAAYLSLFGILQLVPGIRKKHPALHRWNGRIFLALGLSGAITGLYLQWITGLRLSDFGSIGITLNGILIPIAIYFAWSFAVKKRFDLHMRWAVHSFLLVNAVWTFRLYLMGWYMTNQGPNGNTSTVDGPMDIFLSFACYLLPMLVAEVVFWAKKQKQQNKVWGASLVVASGVVITLIGVTAAAMMMWGPRISQALQII